MNKINSTAREYLGEDPKDEEKTRLTHHQTDALRCVKLFASCRVGSLRLR